MHGLVAYDDDDDDSLSDSENFPNQTTIDNNPKNTQKHSADPRRTLKSQVIIKRPTLSHRSHHPRKHEEVHLTEEKREVKRSVSSAPMHTVAEVAAPSTSSDTCRGEREESSHIREILKPPSIPGIDDWGIPSDRSGTCDPALQTKLSQFCSLKKDPSNPKHFNDSLMSNRSFRNPHLYAKLVEFIDVNERVTNFPIDQWNPDDVRPEWFAEQIADAQKEREKKLTTGQGSSKRNRIDFSAASEKEPAAKKGRHYGYHVGGVMYAPSRPRMRLG